MTTKRRTNYKGSPKGLPFPVVAKTNRQKELLRALGEYEQIFVLGPAGTGKTYVTASYFAELYLKKDVDKIVLTRPNISSSKSLGFYPGTLLEKIEPWAVPVMEVLRKQLGVGAVDTAISKGNIEFAPFETMRGRSFENCCVLLDEAQNTTQHEMKMFLTRMGEGSRVVINGDLQQSDLRHESGLSHAMSVARKHHIPVGMVEFGPEDVVRSGLTRQWVLGYMNG